MKKNSLAGICAAALALSLNFPRAEAADPKEFAAECGRRAEAAESKRQRVVAGDARGWLFLTSELRHLAEGAFWNDPEPGSDPAAAIIAYHEALSALNVALVLVPVPAKGSVYPDKLIAETDPGAGGVSLEPFYEKLRAAGLTVVDLAPVLREARKSDRTFCEQDSHWTPLACRIAADAVCATDVVKKLFPVESPVPRAGEEIEITGDLAEALPDAVDGREMLVVYRAATSPVPPDDDSPVLLLGDSHTVVFSASAGTIRHHTTGAGLRDHLQSRLGCALAVQTNASSGGDGARALVARKAQSNPDFWKNRKLVIWCFTAREFTQGRWRVIPAIPGK